MPTRPTDDIKLLLDRVSRGDQRAYELVFTRYWDQVYSTALMFTKSSEISEDLAQDIFARVWEKREGLPAVESFENFLFITARNLFVDRIRREVRSRDYVVFLQEYFNASPYTPAGRLETKELEELVWEGVRTLPAQQQTAFRLSRYEGLDHAAISERMGVSRQSVKSYIVRAIVSLKKYVRIHGR